MMETKSTPSNPLESDAAHLLVAKFIYEVLPSLDSGIIVEIGSRVRSGDIRKQLLPKHLEYVGIDIVDGPNVDLVGDAHELSKHFPKNSVQAVFSMSVFEHLAMPWKVAIEINKILKMGGMSMHTSHQGWPVHEEPWDYWRYSNDTWKTIFNEKTGFEIVEAKMGESAKLHPDYIHSAVADVSKCPLYMMSVVVCKKTSCSELKWDVDLSEIIDTKYPF